jgi:PAS domain S-box-containing protein
MAEASTHAPGVDPLHDPERVAAARRLLREVSGPAAFDRLSRLAARLVGADHAKITIFTDGDLVVGGYGLPEGVVGGPALLTGALSAITVARAAPLNLPSATDDERVAHLPAVTSGQVRSYLGAPLVAASGYAVGALAVYDPTPHDWTDEDVAVLTQLAASVVTELELAAANAESTSALRRLEVALEASSVGIWEMDLLAGTFDADTRCAAIMGYDGPVTLSLDELTIRHVHPDDRAAAEEAIAGAIEARSQYTIEVRNLRPDGEARWTVSRGRVLVDLEGRPVRILGTSLDVTEARADAEARLAAVSRAAAIAEVAAEVAGATRIDQLADMALRGARVLGADSGGVAVRDPLDGKLYVHLGRALEDVVRALPEDIGGLPEDVPLPEGGFEVPFDDALPTQYTARTGERVLVPDVDAAVDRFPQMTEVRRVLGIHALAALPLRVENRLLGSFVATWTHDHPFADEDVELLEGLAAQIALSISRLRADAERDVAVAAMADTNRQLQLLADVGRVLSAAQDVPGQLAQLADLMVPLLGDWGWIVGVDEHARLVEMAAAHRDPARMAEVAAYVRLMATSLTDEGAARIVLRTGRPLVIPEVTPERIDAAFRDQAARDALHALEPAALMAVPLVARGQVLGVLAMVNDAGRGPHTESEIDTAADVGRRAGVALDQMRLFAAQRDLADALQRSMLTDPPQPEGCEIVVRYVPAAVGVEIGGDWYDAFQQPDGCTVLAIGDVAGHDTRAAAAMGQVRGLLRGISYASDRTPAAVLSELDRAMDGLALDTIATALVGELGPGPDGGTQLRWSSAGHPPPVLLTPDGRAGLLEAVPADLMLGVDPLLPRTDHGRLLEPGSTLLLYTDGLVERRDRDIDVGTAALVEAVAEGAALPLDELCDRVLERLFLPDAQDDVAVLAVRLKG